MSQLQKQGEFYSQLRLSRNKLATRALCHISSLNQNLSTVIAQRDELLSELQNLCAKMPCAGGLEHFHARDEVIAARQAIAKAVQP